MIEGFNPQLIGTYYLGTWLKQNYISFLASCTKVCLVYIPYIKKNIKFKSMVYFNLINQKSLSYIHIDFISIASILQLN